jgi:hypothetical protein
MLTKDEIEHYAARLADPKLAGNPPDMLKIIGHLNGNETDAVLIRAAEIARALGKASLDEAEEIKRFVDTRRAARAANDNPS